MGERFVGTAAALPSALHGVRGFAGREGSFEFVRGEEDAHGPELRAAGSRRQAGAPVHGMRRIFTPAFSFVE
jgi:hypothetical protein